MIIYTRDNLEYISQKHEMKVSIGGHVPTENTTAVFCFILNEKEDKILVFKHAKDSGRKVDIPGGHVEVGETLEDSVRREVLEETGYKINLIEYVGMQEIEIFGAKPEGYKYPFPKSNMAFYQARLNEFSEKSDELFDDSEEATWMSIEEALKEVKPEIKNMIERLI